jgi:hypothetical protein
VTYGVAQRDTVLTDQRRKSRRRHYYRHRSASSLLSFLPSDKAIFASKSSNIARISLVSHTQAKDCYRLSLLLLTNDEDIDGL